MMLPVEKSITKKPKSKEKTPPIRMVQGMTLSGKNCTKATNMIANNADTAKLLQRAS